jgi:hypothetical protein
VMNEWTRPHRLNKVSNIGWNKKIVLEKFGIRGLFASGGRAVRGVAGGMQEMW